MAKFYTQNPSSRCNIALLLRHTLYSQFLPSFDWGVSQYSAIQGVSITHIELPRISLIFVRKFLQLSYNQNVLYLHII